MSFYRIYRPKTIDEIDNADVRQHLYSLLTKDRKDLPHAFLFAGSKGSGKTTAARLIAKLYNCADVSKKSGPCGVCGQCKSIETNTNIDVLEIDAASNRGIDEIRELRDRINLAPAYSSYKIYIIDEVHMLTTEAFNALLKTLEEPPVHAVFVLATTDLQKVPVTIQSRCIEIPFRRATQEELTHALTKIIKKEKIDITPDAIALIAEYADGAFRDVVKLLEQVSFSKGKITKESVLSTLAIGEEMVREQFLSALVKKDIHTALDSIVQLSKEGKDLKSFLVDCLRRVGEIFLALSQGNSFSEWTSADCRRMITYFSQAYGNMRITPIPALPIELAVADFCLHEEKIEKQSIPRNVEKNSTKAMENPQIQKKKEIQEQSPALYEEQSGELLTLEKLQEHWHDVIESLKPFNHSVAGVMRSTRPKSIIGDVVTIEAFYRFHQERLSDVRIRDILSQALKKCFGAKMKIEIILGKK